MARSNEPTFEIWQHPEGKVTTVRVAIDGRGSPSLLPGRYCFRASARGFATAVGRIEVRASAPVRNLEVRLPLEN